MGAVRRRLGLRRDPDLAAHADSLAERLSVRRDPVAARALADLVVAQGERYEVDADGVVPHGDVVLLRQGEDAVVVDLRLDEPALAAEVRDLVEECLAAAGARRLACPVPPGDLVRAAFVVGGGFAPVAGHLRLELDGAGQPGPDGVRLRALSPEEATGDGLFDDPDQLLLVGHREGDPHDVVGTLWLQVGAGARPTVLVHEVHVPPTRREQGHGTALLLAAARWARARGASALAIDVAADDHAGRGLVDHLGFLLVEEHHVKELSRA